ncbi:MAG: outer membrane protein assembly factor BamA, partial [Tidjanibacter sp.]|nr:outer membrane protein assembly factor BamA [Tidjanibacter sp.]
MYKRLTLLLSLLALTTTALWAQQTEPAIIAVEGEAPTESTTTDSLAVALDPNAPMADYSAPKKYIIRDIKADGIKYLDANMQINSSGLAVGDEITIPGREISDAITRLWSKQYFSDVQIYATPVGDSVDLHIILAERPRIFRWLFEGISNSATNTLTEELKLKRGAETLTDYNIEKRVNQIKDHYIHKGWRNVEVT